MLELNKCYLGDCLEVMKDIDDKSVDMILCDLPYGVINKDKNKWDTVIPFILLWEIYERIIKENGAIILFASGMFTADIMTSNKKIWKYNLIWKKGDRTSGFLNANRMPMRNHEDICVFYKKQPIYNPQFEYGYKPSHKKGNPLKETNNCYGDFKFKETRDYGDIKFPKSVLNFDKEHPPIHPTQKPVLLCEYLIKTYTNENDIVLDNCMGSGTTAIACINTKRNWIGMEKEPKYFDIIKDRVNKRLLQNNLF